MHHRTQKTSKHKKLKACDPFYSGPRKDHTFKANKYANKAPTGAAGQQEIPRKLRELMEAKEALKSAPSAKRNRNAPRNRNKYADLAESGKEKTGAPRFKQGKYETQLSFFRRMDKTAQEAITKAELEMQFDVNFEKQGKNKLVISTRKDPLALPDKPTKSQAETEPEISRSKSQKRKTKLKEKLETKKAYHRDEFSEMHDDVKFGEVVMAPPQLNAAPRKAPKVKAAGDKKLLLLAQLYPEAEVEEQPEKKSLFADLPAAVTATSIAAARQEVSRQNAVDAYRLLKKQRSQGKKDQTPRSSNNE